jgi:hypothetical protein
MKYVKVIVRKGTTPGMVRMIYPSIYDAQEVEANKRGPLIYNQGIANGGDTEEMLCYLQDAVADSYALHTDCTILSEAQADAWLLTVERLQNQPEEVVTDPNRLLLIYVKAAAAQLGGTGIVLTAEDTAALDPDNPKQGVNRRLKNAASLFG